MQKMVAVAGGSNVDIQGFSNAPIRLRDSNPGRIRLSAGGVGRNIAENLARLGLTVKMISAVGSDDFGTLILEHCKRSGMDISEMEVIPNHSSSAYLVMTDADGDMHNAISDMRIIKEMGAEFIRRHFDTLSRADAIVVDPNLSEEALAELISVHGERPIFADPISMTYAALLRKYLSGLFLVKCNQYEAAVLANTEIRTEDDLTRAAEKIINHGVHSVVITLGTEGCLYANSNGKVIRRLPERVITPVSATGAGDAFTAGMVFGYLAGLSAEEALTLAGRASALALMSESAVNPQMSMEKLGIIPK